VLSVLQHKGLWRSGGSGDANLKNVRSWDSVRSVVGLRPWRPVGSFCRFLFLRRTFGSKPMGFVEILHERSQRASGRPDGPLPVSVYSEGASVLRGRFVQVVDSMGKIV